MERVLDERFGVHHDPLHGIHHKHDAVTGPAMKPLGESGLDKEGMGDEKKNTHTHTHRNKHRNIDIFRTTF